VPPSGIAPAWWTPRALSRAVFFPDPRAVPPYPGEFQSIWPAQALCNGVAEADRRESLRATKLPPADHSLTAAERDERSRLRRENRQRELEREPRVSPASSARARQPGSRGRPEFCRRGLPVHERQQADVLIAVMTIPAAPASRHGRILSEPASGTRTRALTPARSAAASMCSRAASSARCLEVPHGSDPDCVFVAFGLDHNSAAEDGALVEGHPV